MSVSDADCGTVCVCVRPSAGHAPSFALILLAWPQMHASDISQPTVMAQTLQNTGQIHIRHLARRMDGRNESFNYADLPRCTAAAYSYYV